MKVVIIGTGNVGSHLAKALFNAQVTILQIFGRNIEKIKPLALQTNAEPVVDYTLLTDKADVYLLAVSDEAIKEVANKLVQTLGNDILLAHTSGATPASVFRGISNRYGVFYPLQTFSKEGSVDFSTIPFCIDASNKQDSRFLQQLAAVLSEKVYPINDEQRAVLHVAAVMVNNFTNYLYDVGDKILQEKEMPFDLLLPLIEQTVHKLKSLSPSQAQTGPAVRGDQSTIDRHLDFLQKYPDYREIYLVLSKGINDELDL